MTAACTMLDAALDLATKGWAVHPCQESGTRGKSPRTAHGFKDATRNPDVIRQWWTRWPHALIGAAVPDSLLVLDIDPRNGGNVEMLTDAVGPLPATLTAWSGRGDGGRHLYYLRPHGALSSRLLPAGVDLKVSGYCIVPPSPHPSTGQPYRWQHGPIVALPREAREALRLPQRSHRPFTVVSSSGRTRQAAALLRSVQEVHNGRRNDVLYWAARRALEEGHGVQLLDQLEQAAVGAGLSMIEAARTVASARSSAGVR